MTITFKAIALALLCAALCGAATTTITQPIIGPDGTLSTGTATIRINMACTAADGQYVSQDSRVINFSPSIPFSASLEPNDTCVPSGTSYQVAYRVGSRAWNETWVVYASATPLIIANVITAVTPTPLLIVQLPQLNAIGISDGDYCLHVASGKISPTLVACSGGGGAVFSWSAITTSNWDNLTSTQWPTLVF